MRNALVTGVGRREGIGFAIARRLEEAGAQVFTQGWTPHDAAQPSGAHLDAMTGEVAYAVSKGALAIATRTLAKELAERGITVNCINPGPTETGWGLAEIDPAPQMPL